MKLYDTLNQAVQFPKLTIIPKWQLGNNSFNIVNYLSPLPYNNKH